MVHSKKCFTIPFVSTPAGPVIFSPVVFLSKPSHNNTKSTLEASLTENPSTREMENLAVLQRKHGEIFWPACRWMWAKPSKLLLLLAQSRGRLGNTCWRAHFVWRRSGAKLSGTHSGEQSASKSLGDSHILPYWI